MSVLSVRHEGANARRRCDTQHNLAYAQRLGLWGGEDFPFATRAEFVEAIEDGGVAAMEVLARDLRSLGLYTARLLSYDGVEYELIEHPITDEQRRIYDAYPPRPGREKRTALALGPDRKGSSAVLPARAIDPWSF